MQSRDMTRRELIANAGRLAAVAAVPGVLTEAALGATAGGMVQSQGLPAKAEFSIPPGITFLNSAWSHPLPIAGAEAVKRHADTRSRPAEVMPSSQAMVTQVKQDFAALIGATPREISFVPNTSTGENLVVNGLGIPAAAGSGINVVTDGLHFDGALVHLQALQRERKLDLRIVAPRDFRIDIADLERVIDRKTRLVELSLVTMYNGFQHDLKAVCDLAHAHGAYVYADIIQAVGAVPIDVRASGVDFCACSGFKWLMSDFGLGFLYARDDLLERVITRSQWGYHSVDTMQTHVQKYDPAGEGPLSWTAGTTASTHFEVGSNALGALAAMSVGLPLVRRLGVANIEAHRQPLLKRLRDELPRLGFELVTPADSRSPIITFATRNGRAVAEKFRAARINVRVAPNYVRFSPSVFNDMADIDRVLAALA